MQKKCQADDTAIRRMILDAAYKIGMEQGIEKITARRIGAEIGYSTGVIYYHFQNKQEILDILRKDRDRSVYESLQACFQPQVSLRENCGRVLDYIYRFAVGGRDFYIQLCARRDGDSEQRDIWMDLIQKELDLAAERGELAREKIPAAADCLWSFFAGYDLLLLRRCPESASAAEKHSREMLDLLLDGLLKSR